MQFSLNILNCTEQYSVELKSNQSQGQRQMDRGGAGGVHTPLKFSSTPNIKIQNGLRTVCWYSRIDCKKISVKRPSVIL